MQILSYKALKSKFYVVSRITLYNVKIRETHGVVDRTRSLRGSDKQKKPNSKL